jgi:hypothetical protein
VSSNHVNDGLPTLAFKNARAWVGSDKADRIYGLAPAAPIATVQRPGWAGNHIGFYPFPTEIADQMRDDDSTRTL